MEVAGWARYGQMARAQREMGRLEIEWHIYIYKYYLKVYIYIHLFI
jgi:hypothetical protein